MATRKAGRDAIPVEERKVRGARVRALRESLPGKVTQEAFAQSAGVERTRIVMIEKGDNAATGADVQRGLARAAGVTLESLVQYLDGAIALEELRPVSAGRVVAAIEALPGFVAYLQTPDGAALTVEDAQRVAIRYAGDKKRPSSREDGRPAGGWKAYCDDVLGPLQAPLVGDIGRAERLERSQLAGPGRAAKKRR